MSLVGVLVILEKSVVRKVTEATSGALRVNSYVRNRNRYSDAWHTWTPARPGDAIEYLIWFENLGPDRLQDVVVGNNLPKYHNYIPGTTMLRNGANPSGLHLSSDNVIAGGINVGHYEPGAVGYVWFTAQLDSTEAYKKLGSYELRNFGVVRPSGMNEQYSATKVLIDVNTENDRTDH